MNPGLGVLCICVGAIEGWFGSRIRGTFARPRALANISLGAVGALVAAFTTSLVRRSAAAVDFGWRAFAPPGLMRV